MKSGNKASQLLERGALGKLPMLHPSSSHGGAKSGSKGGGKEKSKPKKNRTLDVKVRPEDLPNPTDIVRVHVNET